jgi:adenylate cyclase
MTAELAAVRLLNDRKPDRAVPAIVTALTTASEATAAAPEKSVAVLPFVDMSEKHDQEYFSDGLSEELINALTKVRKLRIPARTASFYLEAQAVKIANVGKELDVANVLEGSVRKSGNQVQVTGQLIRVANDYHVRSQTYDRPLNDLFPG